MNRNQRPAGTTRGQRPNRVTRRGLVAGGAATLGFAAIGGSLRPWTRQAEAQGVPANAAADDLAAAEQVDDGAVFVEPIVRKSSGGILDTSLIAQPDLNAPPGRMTYDGQLPGPTLWVEPGDLLRIYLTNSLGGQITNLHTHGLHVSPSGNGDNVFIHLEPGNSFQYEFAIPEDHPTGLYWYHPHHHGNSMQQVAGGLAGAIVIDHPDLRVPGIDDVRQRLLVLQGPFLDEDGRHYLVNGVENPAIAMQPGERQLWRVLNANANGYYLLTLSGHRLTVISEDGSPVVTPRTVDSLLLGPGERAGLLVDASEMPGTYQLRSLAWGEGGQEQEEFLVATAVVLDGESVEASPLPETVFPWPDLGEATVDRQRTIVFQMNSSDPFFAIDGKAFDEDVVDQVVQLDALEEWVIRNDSDEWHPFHIHVHDFQVMSVNGEPLPNNRNDTFSLPPNGEIVIRIHFSDFTGKFVYHCHILAHEDFGMMAVVDVVAPEDNGISVAASGLASPRDMAWDDRGTMYVVQSGTGVTETSVGTAAAVVRIVDGCPVEVAAGLPSSSDPFRDVLGPSGLVFLDGTLYVLQTATGLYDEMDPAWPNGIYAVEPETRSLRLVADLTTWIRDNPVRFTPGDANELGEPFRILAADDGFWVLEANRGEVLRVTVDGEVTRVADLSEGHPVLSGFALAPEGGVYVGDLTPAPHEDGSAKIVHVAEDGSVRDVWTNLTTVVGILVDDVGILYALEMATDNENGMRPGTGKLVRQTGPDSSEDVITGLDFPIGLRSGPDGAVYIAFPAYGDNDLSGAVIRYQFGGPEPVAFNPSMVVAATCPGAVPYVPPTPGESGAPIAPPDHDHDDDSVAPTAELTIDIQNFAYQPATANIQVGTRITWTNNDSLPHTATANDGTFDSGNIPVGGSFSWTFDTAGSYSYTCIYHPQMTGTIVVS